MLFSFIIPTIDDARVKGAVHSILSSKGWSSNDCEVIVIVNNCPESFYKNLYKEFFFWTTKGVVRILCLEKATIAQARNKSIKMSQGEYVIHIDSDCKIEKGYIKKLRVYISKERFLVGRGAIKFIPTGNLLSRANSQLKELAYFSRKDVCYTPNLIVKSSLYKKVGLFDEKLFHGEDIEWSLRSKKFKIEPVFFNDLVLEHFDPENTSKILLNYFYYGVARVYRFKKLSSERKVGWEKIKFFWRLFNEIPNLRGIHPFLFRLLILFLYFIRNAGVSYGLFKWRGIE